MKRISAHGLYFVLLLCLIVAAMLTACHDTSDEISGEPSVTTSSATSVELQETPVSSGVAIPPSTTQPPSVTEPPKAPDPAPSDPIDADYRYVVLIGVDGAGTFFKNADMPNVEDILVGGARTYSMLSEPLPISAQNWTSMLHGVTFDLHGITNDLLKEGFSYPQDSDMPSIFRIMREQDPSIKMASFTHWKYINTGIIEEGLDVYKHSAETDEELTASICDYVAEEIPHFLFIQYDEADEAGHDYGYETDIYYETLSRIDGYIGQVRETYESLGILDETLFLITSDHGGREQDHGTLTLAERNIMFGAAGHTVEKNGEILDMEIRDIATVVLYALGFEGPDSDKWTSRIPGGLFEGVGAVERHVYVDKESPRYHEPVPTPDYASGAFIGNILKGHSLVSYLTFDGTLEDTENSDPEGNGAISFVDGYFGQGINLNNGYLSMDHVSLGRDSFSVSFWIDTKVSTPNPPIFSNQGADNGLNLGVELYMGEEELHVSISNGIIGMDEAFALPEDYNRGWMHVLLIVDRDAKTVSICYDFGELQIRNIPDKLLNSSFNTRNPINIGQNGSGDCDFKLPCTLDELIIFKGALNENDIRALAEYYLLFF